MTTLDRLLACRTKVLRVVGRKFSNIAAEDIEEIFNDYVMAHLEHQYTDITNDTLHAYLIRSISQRCIDKLRSRQRSHDLCDHLSGTLSDESTVNVADNYQAVVYRDTRTELDLKESNKRYHILMSHLHPSHRRLTAYVFVDGHTREEASKYFKIPVHGVNYILDRVVRPTLRDVVLASQDYDTK